MGNVISVTFYNMIDILKKEIRGMRNYPLPLIFKSAGGETRTLTGFLPLDFESSASTNFTTPAMLFANPKGKK